MKKIGVIGHGSWGTALVKMLCENQEQVHWWIRSEETINDIKNNKHNPNYLQDVTFDISQLCLTSDINQIVADSDIIILAIPSIYIKQSFEKLTLDLKDKIIFSAVKGIVPEDNMILGDFLHIKYRVPYENIGVISGPCHAEEVAMERLSYLTIACSDESKAEIIAKALACRYIKTKVSDDIFGTEYATILKNIYAIAAGMAQSLGYGDNFQAVLVSNAIREMDRFVAAVHPIQRDTKNSAYLGDLLVTAYSKFSRNRMFGSFIGKGYSVKSVIAEMRMVAEGYYASKGIHDIVVEKQINCPISEAVYNIVYNNQNAKKTFEALTNQLD